MKYFKNILIRIYQIFTIFGLDPIKLMKSIRGLPFYFLDLLKIKRQKGVDDSFKFGKIYPILNEKFSESGTMSGHYFHQDLFVARQIFINNPNHHVNGLS